MRCRCDGQRSCILVVADADMKIGVAFKQCRVVQRLEAQLVAGVRCVGYQFAQEKSQRLEYSEWIISCRSCLTSVWNPMVSRLAVTFSGHTNPLRLRLQRISDRKWVLVFHFFKCCPEILQIHPLNTASDAGAKAGLIFISRGARSGSCILRS